MRVALIVLAGLFTASCIAQAPQSPAPGWKEFVRVEGQPEPVPAEWVATPEGKFAHSIKLPNPLPQDSGYRPGMTSEQYFDHLCKAEAGELIYKIAENVDGFYFMRAPSPPTDDDLQARYKLEAPDIERMFQLYRPSAGDRSTIFVIPNHRLYKYIEERKAGTETFVRAFGWEPGTTRAKRLEEGPSLSSRYGLTWRGVRRTADRENAIAGGEWIVLDMRTNEVLSVFRNYARTGLTPNAPQGIWWLNAIQCPNLNPVRSAGHLGGRLYEFMEKVLHPGERRTK